MLKKELSAETENASIDQKIAAEALKIIELKAEMDKRCKDFWREEEENRLRYDQQKKEREELAARIDSDLKRAQSLIEIFTEIISEENKE